MTFTEASHYATLGERRTRESDLRKPVVRFLFIRGTELAPSAMIGGKPTATSETRRVSDAINRQRAAAKAAQLFRPLRNKQIHLVTVRLRAA